MKLSVKDLSAGIFFIAVGACYGTIAWVSLPVGEPLNMGPGFFPIILSACLAVLGLTIVGRGFLAASTSGSLGGIPWRAVVMLSLATIVFSLLIYDLGMFLGVFVTALLARLAAGKVDLVAASVLSLLLALACTLLFGYGIGLPIPIFGTLFEQ